MFRRRKPGRVPARVAAAFEAFRATLERVEAAKASLAAAAPGGRSAGAPLAEALAGFEFGLRDARATMDAWRAVAVEDAWQGCREAVDAVVGQAERLRLEVPPEGYERLYGALWDLLDPLDRTFSVALARFRDLGM